jgi:tetratricopeptide (TPR) repeat protein
MLDPQAIPRNDTLQVWGVTACALLQARVGDSELARQTFRQAEDLIRAMLQRRATRAQGPGPDYYGDLWRQLASSCAEAGEVEELNAILQTLPEREQNLGDFLRSFRSLVLRECALGLVKAGKITEALKLCKEIKAGPRAMTTPEAVKNEVLGAIALHHLRMGNLLEVRQTLDSIPDPAYKVRTLAGTIWTTGFSGVVWWGRPDRYVNFDLPDEPGIALLQNEAGDRDGARQSLTEALQFAQQIPDADKQAYARAVITCAQARIGDLANALKTLERIPADSKHYVYALVAAAKARAAAGQGQLALEAVEKLGTSSRTGNILPPRAYGLAQIAIGQAQASDLAAAHASGEQALKLILPLPDTVQRNTALHILATLRARARDFKGAIETLSQIPFSAVLRFDAVRMGTAYVNVSYEEAKAGAGTGALDIVKAFPRPGDQLPRALRAAARGQTERGEEKEALVWARQLTEPGARGFALLGVAEGLLVRQKGSGQRP